MATLVPIPKLGQSEEVVSIVRWHKQVGDRVAKGDVLFEVETDKAVLEVESQFEGTLLKIVVPEGQEVPVMSIAAVLGEPGEPIPDIPEPPKPERKPEAPTAPAPAAPRTRPAARKAGEAPAETPAPAPAAPPTPVRKTVSPRARRLAKRFLLDPEDIPGTGPGGRVTSRDVLRRADELGHIERKFTPAALNLARRLELTLSDISLPADRRRITVRDVRRAAEERPREMPRMRRVIARRMIEAKQNIPHFYVTVSADMTALLERRRALREVGVSVSINDFIVRAVALALREYPQVNSTTTDGEHVRRHARVNIGIAVSLDDGLLVPVLHDADGLDVFEIHDRARRLIDLAREGRVPPDALKGGTFTISNMGMLNVENFAAIINPGESAILAVSSVVPSPIVDDERKIVVRDLMKMTLSADHRVIDGALAANFINAVRRRLEDVAFWDGEVGGSAQIC